MPKAGQKYRKKQRPSQKELRERIAELQAKVQGRDAELGDLKNRLLYLQAELENLHKRAEKERRESHALAVESTLKRLLPVVDEFDLALRALGDLEEEMADGVRMIYDNLLKVLQSIGLQEIRARGESFDPYVHEAVAYVEDEKEGVVVDVLQKGYRTEGRILRPSQVVVSRKRGETGG